MHEKIKGFDGIRGLAVISVVLTHMGFFGFLESSGYISHKVTPLFQGGTGVQAFFVLSGFLITSLLLKENETYGRVSLKNFYIRRTLRIFPLYILFLLVATLLHVFGQNVTSWDSLFYCYFYIYNFVPKHLYTSFLGHTWSLAVEEHFYLIWPFLFCSFFATKKRATIFALVLYIALSPFLHFVCNYSASCPYVDFTP